MIANAPNPAGQALLGRFFDNSVKPIGLLLGALLPTLDRHRRVPVSVATEFRQRGTCQVSEHATSELPLSGIRVIDLTRVLAGPLCTMLLGDMGAEVIKIEDPGHGDDTREWAPFVDGWSTYFLGVNRNKKSVAIDLKSDDGKPLPRGPLRLGGRARRKLPARHARASGLRARAHAVD